MTYEQVRDAIIAQAGAMASQISPEGGAAFISGSATATVLIDPKTQFVLDVLIADPDPEVPGT